MWDMRMVMPAKRGEGEGWAGEGEGWAVESSAAAASTTTGDSDSFIDSACASHASKSCHTTG